MIFLEADAERDTTATAATWRVVPLGMHEAAAVAAAATASCNCAPWGRLTCSLRHEPDPCQSFCCDAFHRCPRGAYLGNNDVGRAKALLALQRQRKIAGWRAAPWHVAGSAFERSGVSTWCSANVAKPDRCRARPHWMYRGDIVPHGLGPSGRVGFPVRTVHGATVELVHNYKVAGTSLQRHLSCEYGEADDTAHRVSAFAVRDPIARFVSAAAEVLQRVLNGLCPGGPCLHDISRARLRTATLWFPVVERGTAAAAAPEGNSSAAPEDVDYTPHLQRVLPQQQLRRRCTVAEA